MAMVQGIERPVSKDDGSIMENGEKLHGRITALRDSLSSLEKKLVHVLRNAPEEEINKDRAFSPSHNEEKASSQSPLNNLFCNAISNLEELNKRVLDLVVRTEL